ncbi:3-oxoacyl-[acyl-carrier-protein] reductase isoform X1 [Hyla sarda]|uniref:3-oxoacyl-[acyl-carrier-protein] reductase isoform X1 n=1 Tax=Hyla sarda TaxID=327740 RepID=UPI0024C38EB2|nr:3-oxoacyl-[acyl-carrier-protein] reductase isoform X1 [Hyla sarda]XP_056417012.1 3-oxoacyl-[acyl-carrier-protein] reductase isoform X1 [Hyla sarda]XP_056417023.1 3-oxoacyl-[acyl-carrier-protein] reductase isoform X1 [Hyla sarda]XP_056417032.1 3-oxoacyl-[acyl-carrier-protein] reductase isoform X1 [Hyla sarda]
MSKVCAVFGGSRGIGKAVAKLLVQRNYKVAVISRNLDAAKATTEELGGHLALSCDVAQEQAVQRTFEEIVKKIGNVNCLVNAAGINRDALLLRTKTEDILSQLSVNLIGSMYTCKVALRGMVQQQDGAIVNIGSIVGHKGNAGQSVYSASKEGLVGFSKSLAKEVAKKNVRVNVVAPGFIHTDMTSSLEESTLNQNIPLGRFGEADDVAQAVTFLLSSPYITGHVLVVDGGLQLQM